MKVDATDRTALAAALVVAVLALLVTLGGAVTLGLAVRTFLSISGIQP